MTFFIIVLALFIVYYIQSNKQEDVLENNTYQSETNDNYESRFLDNKKTTSIVITGPIPEKTTDFIFYKFVEQQPKYILEPWFKEMQARGYKFNPDYANAVNIKIDTDKFKNPIDFDEFYQKTFDYIAIDFETANEERISACKIGIAFVHNDTLVNSESYFIKPPNHIKFNSRNVQIHGITADDVEYASDFSFVWDSYLKKYFNCNLLVLHNASMDASVLKQLFQYYKIEDYNLKYVDTLRIAKSNGYPGKLSDLCVLFNHNINEHHNPEDDAVACAVVTSNFIEKGINLSDYEKIITPLTNELQNNNINTREKRIPNLKSVEINITSKEIGMQHFEGKKVIFTGIFSHFERDELREKLIAMGAVIVTSISRKLNIIIIGDNPGPSKIEKIEELQSKGYEIEVMTKDIFLSLIRKK
jgi:DNA polymerase III subunit epsilon